MPFAIIIGDTAGRIAQRLYSQGLISAALPFVLYARFTGKEKNFLAGEYVLPSNLSIRSLAQALTSGEYLDPGRLITIPEGWGLREIGEYLERQGVAQAEELWKITGFPAVADYALANLPQPKDFSLDFPFLKDRPSGVSLEGYLFPDSYRILKTDNLEKITRAMLANFAKKISPDIMEAMERNNHPLFEIVTMASIIEREIPLEQDRPVAAGILWKRLKTGMPLQVDSSVNYVTGGKSRALSAQELAIASPYNTYTHRGLPPGPIANPGLSALRAASYPQDSPFWYFLSKEDGETVFSKTLAEHVAAKRKYMR